MVLSPLAGTTDDQADALVSALNKASQDVEFKLYLGLNTFHHLSDAVEQMRNDGITEAITVVLAPLFFIFSRII